MQTHPADHRVDVLLIALVRDPIGSPTNLPIENPDFIVVVALGPQDRPNLDLVPIGRDAGRPLEIKIVEPVHTVLGNLHALRFGSLFDSLVEPPCQVRRTILTSFHLGISIQGHVRFVEGCPRTARPFNTTVYLCTDVIPFLCRRRDLLEVLLFRLAVLTFSSSAISVAIRCLQASECFCLVVPNKIARQPGHR